MMFVLSDAAPDAVADESDVEVWVDELDASGRRLIGDILDPGNATTVRVRGGETLVSDRTVVGDQLWGFDILEVEDVAEAIAVASRHPMARNGQLELRPFPE
ncbi:YciI family protein [Herbiconiux sp. 11R-BC]|uniref:YciI family protein n=1 Tax=Herbiconiux sp. 11R-BC TaxID=3111637 RepID=UPI003C0BA2F6